MHVNLGCYLKKSRATYIEIVKQKKEEVMNMNFNLDQVPYLAEVDRLLMRD